MDLDHGSHSTIKSINSLINYPDNSGNGYVHLTGNKSQSCYFSAMIYDGQYLSYCPVWWAEGRGHPPYVVCPASSPLTGTALTGWSRSHSCPNHWPWVGVPDFRGPQILCSLPTTLELASIVVGRLRSCGQALICFWRLPKFKLWNIFRRLIKDFMPRKGGVRFPCWDFGRRIEDYLTTQPQPMLKTL